MSVKLCFAAFIKVLLHCAVHKTTQKALCAAVVSTIDHYYGEILSTDESAISRIMSCDNNLSPESLIKPAKSISRDIVIAAMAQNVIPLLDTEKIPLAILALQHIILDSVNEDDTCIGNTKRGQLVFQTAFNPVEFFTDVLFYTVINIPNKDGKATIKQLTAEYIHSFEHLKHNITIEEIRVLPPLDLPTTLMEEDFAAVFTEVNHNGILSCPNHSALKLYCLDISDSSFDYAALNEYLFDSVGMYVYSRTQIKALEDARRGHSIVARALRQMRDNGEPDERGTGNELGEMLLYIFMENGLRAPKILSKVEIGRVDSQFHSKSDAVHLLKRAVNGKTEYQLVFGASSIDGNINAAIDNSFDVINDIKAKRTRERQMVDSTLFNHTFDAETTEQLKQILIPSRTRQTVDSVV